MNTCPAPWRKPIPRRSLGASLSDFQSYLADPNFANAWSGIQNQLAAEGLPPTDARINTIKTNFLDAYSSLSDANRTLVTASSSADIANAAQQYILTGQTIAGAVQTINGLVQTAQTGAPGEVVTAFTGTLVGELVLTGALATGVGAAIVGAVSGLVAILGNAGLLSGPPLGVQICPHFYCDPAPAWTVAVGQNQGCVCVWPDPGTSAQIQPGSSDWRSFPQPNNPADAAWFAVDGRGPGGWKKATWSTSPDTGARPIDSAFPVYRQLECEIAAGYGTSISFTNPTPVFRTPDPFLLAFFSAWKRNAEWALNGLKAADDKLVLIQTVRLWNAAHSNSTRRLLSPIPYNPYVGGAPCGGVRSYAAMLVNGAGGVLGRNDSDIWDDSTGSLIINTGPAKNPPVVTAIGSQKTMPVVQKIAIGAGIAAAGVGAWAYMQGISYTAAWRKIYAATAGRFLR